MLGTKKKGIYKILLAVLVAVIGIFIGISSSSNVAMAASGDALLYRDSNGDVLIKVKELESNEGLILDYSLLGSSAWQGLRVNDYGFYTPGKQGDVFVGAKYDLLLKAPTLFVPGSTYIFRLKIQTRGADGASDFYEEMNSVSVKIPSNIVVEEKSYVVMIVFDDDTTKVFNVIEGTVLADYAPFKDLLKTVTNGAVYSDYERMQVFDATTSVEHELVLYADLDSAASTFWGKYGVWFIVGGVAVFALLFGALAFIKRIF